MQTQARTGRRRQGYFAQALMAALVLAWPRPSGAETELPALACGWSVKLNGEHGINAGWPDNAASYWYAAYATIPGARLVIRGIYPRARFFTIDVYDSKANPLLPGFVDRSLAADPGSENPFTTVAAPGEQHYTAYVEFTSPPPSPAPNTVYAGTTIDGAPNPGGLLTLRIYLPDVPGEDGGGVPLPDLAIETVDGSVSIPLRSCSAPEEVPVEPAILEVIGGWSYPDPLPPVVPFPLASDPAVWTVSTNPDVDSFLLGPLPVIGPSLPKSHVGLLTTPSQSYIATRISRDHGEIFVLRAKPPLSPDTRAGEWAGAVQQVRYWSWCAFSTMTGQTAACIADHDFVLDPDGLYTLVFSDADHRPANAPNWLPLGDPYDGWPTFRQFLPDETFSEAIAHIPPGTSPAAAMGPYFPRSAYCTQAAFEQNGVSACLP